MFAEAAEACAVVAAQLAANQQGVRAIGASLRARPPHTVVTFARGSSDHAATFAKYLFETRAGVLTASGAPSIASIYGAPAHLDGVLALAISQSGRSPDLLSAMAAAKGAGAETLALVNADGSPLGELAGTLLPLCAGPERSVAATKSFIATLSALVHLVAVWREDGELADALAAAPALLARAWEADWTPLVDGLAQARGLYVIGRGLGLGIAEEAALKMKETCGLHAEAFSAAEVRHGPMALIGPDLPLLILRQSDETGPGIDDLAAEMAARGGPVFLAGASGPIPGVILLPGPVAHPAIEPMLRVQSFYRAVNALSVTRAHNPDAPPHLSKVTETL